MDFDESANLLISREMSCPPPPPLEHIRFVEDGDLWRWALPDSREFHAGVAALNLEYDVNKNPGIFDVLQVSGTGFNLGHLTCCRQVSGTVYRARVNPEEAQRSEDRPRHKCLHSYCCMFQGMQAA